MIKRIFTVLLLVTILFLTSGGTFVCFMMQQANYFSMMKKIESAGNKEVLILSMADFKKAKFDKHELKWQGKMYDISKTEFRNGEVYVYCIHDQREDSILKAIAGLGNNGKQDAGSVKIFQFLCDKADFFPEIRFYFSVVNIFAANSAAPENFCYSGESPPPRC